VHGAQVAETPGPSHCLVPLLVLEVLNVLSYYFNYYS